jgi:Flp pilus assembly protein TadG
MNKRHNIQMKDQRGQSMVELAIILPVFVVLLFGIIQFGIAFNNYVTLTDAARAGARTGSISRTSSTPVADCTNAVVAAASNLDKSKLSVQCTSTWAAGSTVQVSASYPYTINLLGIPVVTGNLTTTMTERVE